MEDQRLSIFITISVVINILISSTLVSTHPLARATNDYGGYHAESYPEDHPSDPSYNQQPSGASTSYSSLTQQPLNTAYSLTSYLNPVSYFSHGSGGTGGSYGAGSGSHDPSYGTAGSSSYGTGSGTHDPSYGGSNPYGAGPHDPSYTPGGSPGYGSDPHQPPNPHDPSYTPGGSPGYGSDPHQPPTGYKPASGMPNMAYGSAKSSGTEYGSSSLLNVDLKYGSSGTDSKYGPPPPPPGMDSKYGPPPPGMDPKYGPPPPPPGMDSKYGPPPPPPGMDSKYGPPHGPPPPNMDPKYGGGSNPSDHSPGNNRAYDLASGAKYPDYSSGSGSGGYSTGGAY